MDDAETLLQLAQSQMRESQAKNRERAVQAITQKNNLQALAEQTQKMVDNLGAKADIALKSADDDTASRLRAEREMYQATLTETHASLKSAIEAAEAVKDAMRQDEERIRARTAQALAMKAQHRQAQIEFEIEKSRLGMTTTKAGELLERAQAKIQQAQARRDLMGQIRKTAETLEKAAEAAEHGGDTSLSQQLLSERDELKKAALNPNLWKQSP